MTFTTKTIGAALRGFSMLGTAATALAMTIGTQATADQVFNDDVIVDGNLCVGTACVNEEVFGAFDTLKLSGLGIGILFNDTGGTSENDWRIQANATSEDSFFFTDVTGGTSPFKILGGAPSSSLFVAADGNVGLGTSLPQSNLHIFDRSAPDIRFEALGETTQIGASNFVTFFVYDQDEDAFPFSIGTDAPDGAMSIMSNGNIGLGVVNPEGKLHTRGDGVQLVYFESTDGGPVQVRFRTDSENRRFLAVNNANEVKSQIVFGDDQITFLGQTVANEWLRISDAGIVSSGPTCNPNPCDATFDPDAFTVPAIEERAALMWENMYLPAVGPTAPEAPFNVTEKMGGVIHELEVAHIYIEQLHDRLTAQETEIARASALEKQVKQQDAVIASLVSRLDAIEAQ